MVYLLMCARPYRYMPSMKIKIIYFHPTIHILILGDLKNDHLELRDK